MPNFLRSIADRIDRKEQLPVNSYEGFKGNGAVVMRDRRGTVREEVPQATEKSLGMGDDPLAIWKPTGAKSVGADKAMANFTGWAYAAVNAIGMEVVGIKLRLYRVKGSKNEEIEDHPILDLLDFPNEDLIGHELIYATIAHLELAGNAYWYLDGVDGPTGQPKAIFPLNPGRMRVKLDKSSFPYRIGHYEYTIDGKIIPFGKDQILHIRYPDPNDAYLGIGVPQTIPTWIDSDNYAMEYNRRFFINGAHVGGVLETDTNVEGNIDRIRRSWANRQEGVENAHKTPVLPKGVKYERSGLSQKDMDFSNLTDKTRDRILAGFRVSKTILGTAESDTNRSTAETADYVFGKRTIKPKMELFTAFLNARFVPRWGDDLYITFIDPTPEDREFRTKEMQAATGNAPTMTPNEARKAYLGLDPIAGGDQLMQPNTLVPVGTTDKPEGEDPAPDAAKTAKTIEGWNAKAFRIRTGRRSVRGGLAELQKSLIDIFKKALDSEQKFQVKSVTELTHAEYMEHYKRFDARTVETVHDLIRVFQLIDQDQQKEVLENLPEYAGIEKDAAELFDVSKWINITIDLATPILARLAGDEATSALAIIGAKHQDILADQATRDALDTGIAKMARSYNETTLEQLKKVLGDEMTAEGGTSLPKLKEAVQGVYSFADEKRAARIAQTEAYRAANWANKEAWKASGVVKTVKWYTAEDQQVCQYCAAMEEKGAIDINDDFAKLGDTIKGVEGGLMTADYGDIEAPPCHPSCRCFIRPEEISLE